MNKYKDWFVFLSCALDNVPTDQPSAPKVDTNQLTKKNWRTLSLPLAESISSWYVPTEPTQSSSGPISSLKTSLERRLNCACASVCVREWESNVTETESGSMASERERRRQPPPPPTLQAAAVAVVVFVVFCWSWWPTTTKHARSCSTWGKALLVTKAWKLFTRWLLWTWSLMVIFFDFSSSILQYWKLIYYRESDHMLEIYVAKRKCCKSSPTS